MKSSNISRDKIVSKWLSAVLATVCSIGTAYGIDPNRAMSQYIRDKWGPENGLSSGPIYAITQTADGYLWIGTEAGLFCFDGFSFRLIEARTPASLPVREVHGLTPGNHDSLWLRLPSTVLLYRSGQFKSVMSDMAEEGATVTAMCPARGGAVLFSSVEGGVAEYQGAKSKILATAASLPRSPVISLAETLDRDIWLGTRDAGLFSLREAKVSTITRRIPDLKINCILPFDQNKLWVGTDNGIVRWNGTEITTAGIPGSLRHVQVLAMTKDHDSNLWVGTASKGLVRLNARGASSLDKPDQPSTNALTAVFEDRERDLWFGGVNSLERLRDSAFVSYSRPEGLPEESNGPVYVDSQGRTWFAPLDGGLYWLKERDVENINIAGLNKDVVYSIAGGPGEVWVGRQRGGLTCLRIAGHGFTAQTYSRAEGLAQNSVYAVYRSADGTVWAGTLSGGVSHYQNGKFTTYTIANGLPSNTINAIVEDSAGTMWFATPNGLSALSKGRWKVYGVQDGLPAASIHCLTEDSRGVLWIGSENGLAYLRNGRVQVPLRLPPWLHEQIAGIAEDRNGSLWIATSGHVLEVNRDRLLKGTLGRGDVQAYGLADGLRGSEGVRRCRSVVADALGRIWFSLNRGISVVDPTRMPSSAPVIPHIQAVLADGASVDLSGPVRISSARRRITFDYVGLSLSIPDRVKYRYMLEGFDHNWSEPVTTREAMYTNLSPGSYRFHVLAGDGDDLRNGAETALAIDIEPLFWQTWWFRLVCVLTFLSSVLAASRVRMHQVKRQLHLRVEERLAERTRIARELHDTLLQSFQGLLLRFQAVSNLLPTRPEEAKQKLDGAIDQAAQAITESRDAVHELRSSTVLSNDLGAAIAALAKEFAADQTGGDCPDVGVQVEGAPRDLNPIFRDEIYRIAAEALRNACRYSRARHIEVEIRYNEGQLELRVRDDGKGIDPNVLDGNRPAGHWGLRGMRERAKLVGGNLDIWSKLDSGTEVELIVPASVAYGTSRSPRRPVFFQKK